MIYRCKNCQRILNLDEKVVTGICAHCRNPKVKTMEQVKMEYAIEIWKRFDFNQTHAADALDISVRTLRTIIQDYKKLGAPIPEANLGRPRINE